MDLGLIKMSHNPQQVIPHGHSYFHLAIHNSFYGLKPCTSGCLLKHSLKRHHDICSGSHPLMLLLQHVGHWGQHIATSHIIGCSPLLISISYSLCDISHRFGRASFQKHKLVLFRSNIIFKLCFQSVKFSLVNFFWLKITDRGLKDIFLKIRNIQFILVWLLS